MSPTDSKIAIKIFWPLNIEILHHFLLAGWMLPHIFQIGLSCIVSTLEQKPVGLGRMICTNMEVKTAIFILENLILSLRDFQCKRMTLHVILCIRLIFPAWVGKVFGRQQLAYHYACHRVHLRWNPLKWTWKRIPFIFKDSRSFKKGLRLLWFQRNFFNLDTDLQHPFSGFQLPACPEFQIFVVWSFLGHAFSIRSLLRFRRQLNLEVLHLQFEDYFIIHLEEWDTQTDHFKVVWIDTWYPATPTFIPQPYIYIHTKHRTGFQLSHPAPKSAPFFSNTKELDHKNTICHILFQNGFYPWQSCQTIQVTRTAMPPRLSPCHGDMTNKTPVYGVHQQRTGPKKRSHGFATKQLTDLKSGKRSKVHGLFCQLMIEHFDIALLASAHRGCCLSHLVDMHIFWPWKSEIMSDTPQCWDGWTFVSVQTLIYSCHPKGPHLWLQ